MAGNRGLPPLFGAPWEREDVEFDREAAREAAREKAQRAEQREAATKLRGEFFKKVPDPNMPRLFIPPWERGEEDVESALPPWEKRLTSERASGQRRWIAEFISMRGTIVDADTQPEAMEEARKLLREDPLRYIQIKMDRLKG